jgi:uracil-DNA glycosylase family protein
MDGSDSRSTAARFVPRERTVTALTYAARACRGCSLYRSATQTVFGEGPERARLMLVGEMPGDEEDLTGSPFVGPAGRVLDDALKQAQIDRGDAYVTNVVKHFKWEPRGRRRLHKTPSAREIGACMPWLDAEIDVVRPQVLVCLGATAAKALLGSNFRVSQQRGQFVESDLAPHVTATGHPSAVLRMRDVQARARAMRQLVEDLTKVARMLNDDP